MEATVNEILFCLVIIVFAALVSLLIISLSPCTLRAQSWNSHLEGLITDPSGAVIPGAQVKLKNAATGQVRQNGNGRAGLLHFSPSARGRV